MAGDNLSWHSQIKVGIGFLLVVILSASWYLYSEQNIQINKIMYDLNDFVRNSIIESNKHNLEATEKFYRIQLNIEKNNLNIMAFQRHIIDDRILNNKHVKNIIREGVP